MGMHVPSPVDMGDNSPCACLAQPPSAGRPQHGRCMSLPSPVEVSAIEIESAHTPIPLGGFSGGSPTGRVNTTPGRKQRERKHSGRCFVTLKRKGTRDIVRQTHARSASMGSVDVGPAGSCCCGGCGGGTPGADPTRSEFFPGGGNGCDGGGCVDDGDHNHHHINALEADAPLCTAVRPPTPPPLRRTSRSGSGPRGGAGRAVPAVASLEDAAQRIAVDPESGSSYFVERSTVCDACPYCDDACEVARCNGCNEKRDHLEEAYGPIMLSVAEMDAAGAARGGFCARGVNGVGVGVGSSGSAGSNSDEEGSGGGGGGGSRVKLAPVLSRRYPQKSSYTLCEVRRRKVTGACWIVSQGSVYDVTAALADHPGGKRSVLRNAGGRDCAEDFFFHSKAAKKQWRQYRIGSLVACGGETERDGRRGSGEGCAGERLMRTGSDCVIS